jgi:hypothetical protein
MVHYAFNNQEYNVTDLLHELLLMALSQTMDRVNEEVITKELLGNAISSTLWHNVCKTV